jgi:hypothetical protein
MGYSFASILQLVGLVLFMISSMFGGMILLTVGPKMVTYYKPETIPGI